MAGNQQKSENFAKVNDVYFVERFADNIRKLTELLNITRKVEKVPGQQIKTYKVVGSLANETVAEGDDIPLSEYSTEVADAFDLSVKKYRKETTFEAIADKGYEQAVSDTDDKMLSQIQGVIRSELFAALGTGTGTAEGLGLRGALAHARAKLKKLFEDNDVSDTDLIYFVNPDDVADYLEDKDVKIVTQEAFGLTYVQGFLNTFDVVEYSQVPKGVVYATAKDNLILYYMNPANTEIGRAFSFTTDQTGYIGVHHDTAYKNLSTQTVAVVGVKLHFELVDRMLTASILDGDGNPVGVTFKAVASPTGNPKTKGYYELDGAKYVKTADTTVESGKTYYEASRAEE